MFYDLTEEELLMCCLGFAVLGMFARVATQERFTNGISVSRQIIISIFLSVVMFLVMDVVLPDNLGEKTIAVTKILSAMLGAGYFYDSSILILNKIYKKFVLDRLALASSEESSNQPVENRVKETETSSNQNK